MFYKFKDDDLQKEYEDKKKFLIDKYGKGCSAVYFSSAVITNLEDNSQQIDVTAIFEKNGIEENYESIEDENSSVGYVSSFKENEIEEDDFTEIIKL